MLEQILRHIAAGGLHSYTELARELDVSETLLEQMLQDLERMGYLEKLGGACDCHCDHCDLSSACAVQGPSMIWRLTDKSLPF